MVGILEGDFTGFVEGLNVLVSEKNIVSMQKTINLYKCQLILSKTVFILLNRNNYHFMFKGTAVSFYVDTKRCFAT